LAIKSWGKRRREVYCRRKNAENNQNRFAQTKLNARHIRHDAFRDTVDTPFQIQT
jgi:hypothetical protein